MNRTGTARSACRNRLQRSCSVGVMHSPEPPMPTGSRRRLNMQPKREVGTDHAGIHSRTVTSELPTAGYGCMDGLRLLRMQLLNNRDSRRASAQPLVSIGADRSARIGLARGAGSCGGRARSARLFSGANSNRYGVMGAADARSAIPFEAWLTAMDSSICSAAQHGGRAVFPQTPHRLAQPRAACSARLRRAWAQAKVLS
jgi:hypothetical protein